MFYNKRMEYKDALHKMEGGNPFREKLVVEALLFSNLTERQIAKRFNVPVKAVRKVNKEHKCR